MKETLVVSHVCDTGYELTGSHTRTCRNDESWSGIMPKCRKSK